MSTSVSEPFVKDLVFDVLKEPVRSVNPIEGYGVVNQTFRVETADRSVILKVNAQRENDLEFRKESYCMRLAARACIPSPEPLAYGTHSNIPYLLQSYVEGINGQHATDPIHVWYTLGQYARRIHEISVEGFGSILSPNHYSPTSLKFRNNSWSEIADYWMSHFFENPRLLETGVFDENSMKRTRQFLEPIREWKGSPALCHGDLKPKNTIVNNSGHVTLLDWGNAEGHYAPIFDLGDHHCWKYGPEENRAFRAGLGISDEQFRNIKPQIDRLTLIRALASAHWAVDDSDRRPEDFIKHAREKIDELIPTAKFRIGAAISRLTSSWQLPARTVDPAHQMARLVSGTGHK